MFAITARDGEITAAARKVGAGLGKTLARKGLTTAVDVFRWNNPRPGERSRLSVKIQAIADREGWTADERDLAYDAAMRAMFDYVEDHR